MNLLNALHDPELPTWKFVTAQTIIGLTTLAVIAVAISTFSLYASLSFAIPFAITGAIGIYMGSQFYKDLDNHRYSYAQQIMAGSAGGIHLAAFIISGSLAPLISGSLLTLYFAASYYIDRDKVEA